MLEMYHENELFEPVHLCDQSGNLNTNAIGFSRHPFHICNLKRHWPRKKRWNYWAILSETHLFSVTLSNVDYMGLPFIYLLDFKDQTFAEKTLLKPFGSQCHLGPLTEDDVIFDDPAMPMQMIHVDGGVKIHVESPDFEGKPLKADFMVHYPKNHETLNVVIPWSKKRFQFTSKQNTLPAEGTVHWGDKTITFDSSNTFACLDFGRGIWPFESSWNWSSFSTRLDNGDSVGVNLGAKWTDGTSYNENGLCINGILTKISEDIVFDYDSRNFMTPWHLHTTFTDRVDLTFEPFFERHAQTNALFIYSEVHQMFGRFYGTLKPQGGDPIQIDGPIGWAEDHHAKW
jgi:hypothetical protein